MGPEKDGDLEDFSGGPENLTLPVRQPKIANEAQRRKLLPGLRLGTPDRVSTERKSGGQAGSRSREVRRALICCSSQSCWLTKVGPVVKVLAATRR